MTAALLDPAIAAATAAGRLARPESPAALLAQLLAGELTILKTRQTLPEPGELEDLRDLAVALHLLLQGLRAEALVVLMDWRRREGAPAPVVAHVEEELRGGRLRTLPPPCAPAAPEWRRNSALLVLALDRAAATRRRLGLEQLAEEGA